MWIFGRWALRKVPLMKWRWSCMWSIRKIVCCIYEDHYYFDVQLFWRASGLQAIGGQIMLGLHCQPWWTLLISEIQFELLIVSQRTCDLHLHTHHLEILMLEILCSWDHMIQILFLFRWEEWKVMLSRMKKMNILKWWEFNGGFLWKKNQIWMNDICMKIVRMGSGNVI